jgi:hypothetical protein
MLATGLRIGDAVTIRKDRVVKTPEGVFRGAPNCQDRNARILPASARLGKVSSRAGRRYAVLDGGKFNREVCLELAKDILKSVPRGWGRRPPAPIPKYVCEAIACEERARGLRRFPARPRQGRYDGEIRTVGLMSSASTVGLSRTYPSW